MRLALIALIMACAAARAGEIEGQPRPVDGDSFNIEIRIFGIDTPESNQTCKDANGVDYLCGRVANEAMAKLIKNKTVRCEIKDQDTKYGRPVAICYADGMDIGAHMVERGLAVAYREYSDRYVPNEERAKISKRGIWAGPFEMPWDYRARKRQESAAALFLIPSPSCPPVLDPLPSECDIKGNIGKKGAQIYHTRASRDYENTNIDPAKGERHFCSEAEALACGWRAPGK